MLAFLKSAYRVSGGDKYYLDALKYLVEENGYDKNLINLKIDTPDDNNYSDDELSLLPFHLWTYTENFP